MAIITKAYILCATDDPTEALEATYAALNSAVFSSSSPILDFTSGIEGVMPVDETYQDGEFISYVPGARHMQAANDINLPC